MTLPFFYLNGNAFKVKIGSVMFASENYLFLQGKENPFDSMFVRTFFF